MTDPKSYSIVWWGIRSLGIVSRMDTSAPEDGINPFGSRLPRNESNVKQNYPNYPTVTFFQLDIGSTIPF